ncbi:MAG: hypothetical protein ABH874_06185 [Methanobacteriota archaeon]
MYTPKANIETKEGTKIIIEGTQEEVASIVSLIKKREEVKEVQPTIKKKAQEETKKTSKATDLILSLREEGFFDKPKSLVEIKNALEEQGYYYPITTLSGVVLNILRKKNLGRIKQDKRWLYVKR